MRELIELSNDQI